MFFLESLIIFVFGLLTGSFLNCIVYRLENNESFLKGRSFCPICKKNLEWVDLIPLVSFFLLKRKCRYCSKPISWHYPLIEVITGGVFVFVFHQANVINWSFLETTQLIYFLAVSFIFLFVFIYDIKHYIIPDEATISVLILSFFWLSIAFLNNLYSLKEISNYLLSGIGACLFFLSFYLISKGKWMGFGDVKFSFALGVFLGFPKIVVGLFFSFLLGAIIGLVSIILKKKEIKSEIPFAPFLILGSLIALFWGELILSWYINLLNVY
jgi:prepilin signal peptidase PulO-like enzyme (type II secretory pathway)